MGGAGMRLTTKGGRPKTSANADTARSRCLTVYFYKTLGDKTVVHVWHNSQDKKTGRWKRSGKPNIFHAGTKAAEHLRDLLASWE